MRRVAILMNDLPPYRVPIYQQLANEFDVSVFLSGEEDNRNWKVETSASDLHVKRSWGFTFKHTPKDESDHVVDIRYLHLTPGLILDLIRFRPRAIISTEMGIRSTISLIFGFITRVPVWVWWGGTLHTERNRSLLKRVLRACFFVPFTRRWISYGKSSTKYLKSIGVDTGRILEVQNSANYETYGASECESLSLIGQHPRILYVGQLIRRKGIYELLESVARVHRKGHTFSLVIVGDGPEASRIDHRINELKLDFVQRVPYVAPEAMPSVYKSCDALVFPTLEDVWGLVVNEALMCERPVLVSKYAGSAEELAHPKDIFDPLNPDEFDSVMERAITGELNPPYPERLWSNGLVAEAIADAIRRA